MRKPRYYPKKKDVFLINLLHVHLHLILFSLSFLNLLVQTTIVQCGVEVHHVSSVLLVV